MQVATFDSNLNTAYKSSRKYIQERFFDLVVHRKLKLNKKNSKYNNQLCSNI